MATTQAATTQAPVVQTTTVAPVVSSNTAIAGYGTSITAQTTRAVTVTSLPAPVTTVVPTVTGAPEGGSGTVSPAPIVSTTKAATTTKASSAQNVQVGFGLSLLVAMLL